VEKISHETVRRWLNKAGLRYRHSKEWLTSPDPLYALHKRQRDRLLVLARQTPGGAAVWLDQSWFVRWPYRFWAWDKKPPQVAKRWVEKVDTVALYATLDDESQEAFLDWVEGQPNSDKTVAFLEKLMSYWTQQGKRFIVLFWDRAPWHKSRQTRQWIRAYNQRAKQDGLTRLVICYLPTRSPWLMPLEAVFGRLKQQVLGGRMFATVAEMKGAVEQRFEQRVVQAKKHRDQTWSKRLSVPVPKSGSVL
jgi:hypothetical protein